MNTLTPVAWPIVPLELGALVDHNEGALLQRLTPALATHIGPAASVLVCGPNAAAAARALLDGLERPKGLVLLGPDFDMLTRAAARLSADAPEVEVRVRQADVRHDPVIEPMFDTSIGPVVVMAGGATLSQCGALGVLGGLVRLATFGGPQAWLILSFEQPGDPALKEALHRDTMAKRMRALLPSHDQSTLRVWADHTGVQGWAISSSTVVPVARVDFFTVTRLEALCAEAGLELIVSLTSDDGSVGLAVLRNGASVSHR
jgi:hypothetical protein